jgi:hypothetical protein
MVNFAFSVATTSPSSEGHDQLRSARQPISPRPRAAEFHRTKDDKARDAWQRGDMA